MGGGEEGQVLIFMVSALLMHKRMRMSDVQRNNKTHEGTLSMVSSVGTIFLLKMHWGTLIVISTD